MAIQPDVLYDYVLYDVMHLIDRHSLINELPPEAGYKAFAAKSLLTSLLKKWSVRGDNADIAAITKFSAFNEKCRVWSLLIESESDRLLYGEFRREIDNFLHPSGECLIPSYSSILDESRCGPGASLGSMHQSTYAKMYSSKMATTSLNLYQIYRDYISGLPTMCEAERQRHTEWGYPSIVDCSKLSFVPKTIDISRIICTEPSLNMLFQLGLGAILERRMLSRFGTDLATQPDKNRRLAQRGSKEGSFATIDLSSASDSISLSMCREIFPTWFFQILENLRVPNTLVNGSRVPLYMVSTMGNGFTFPLQTIIFSCLIRACYSVEGLSLRDGKGNYTWGCFGDDLICDTSVYHKVRRLLAILGFTTNDSKTFFEGPFRESCGTDWFYGQPVRGVYIKHLDTRQDICVAINLLNEWSARTGIGLNSSITYLVSQLKEVLFVPFDENMDSGIRVPSSFLKENHFKYDCNSSMLYRAYRSKSTYYVFNEDGSIVYPKKAKRNLSYNPSGLLLSFLQGEIVRCKISTRNSRSSYRTKVVCTPFWDYIPRVSEPDGFSLTWRQWETAVLNNMSNSL